MKNLILILVLLITSCSPVKFTEIPSAEVVRVKNFRTIKSWDVIVYDSLDIIKMSVNLKSFNPNKNVMKEAFDMGDSLSKTLPEKSYIVVKPSNK